MIESKRREEDIKEQAQLLVWKKEAERIAKLNAEKIDTQQKELKKKQEESKNNEKNIKEKK